MLTTDSTISTPVIDMLSPEEEKLVALIAKTIVDQTLKQAHEESHTISPVQQ